ncbi:MAG: tetratricopeptide repeat protein [Candidatus Neomarinimicrobiota bacterium]|nr:tetratricopeptide repeat protein [Candidatus Neomarinimicrobiota bacterium]
MRTMKKSYLRIIFFCFLLSFSLCQFMSSMKTARIYEMNKDWDSAISIYKDIISKSPNNFQAIRNLKNIYKKSQRYDDGINFLKYYLNRNPKDIQLHIELGEFYYLKEEISLAKKVWSDGINNFKSNKSYYRILLSTYDKYSLEKEIFNMIKKGRDNFGKNFLAQELGSYYQRRKEYKKAIDEYILTLLSNTGSGSTVSRRILMMSDDSEAKGIIEIKLLETSTKYPDILLPTLADHYFKHGDYFNSYNTYLEWADKGFFNAKKWLDFANSLRKEESYSFSIKAYEFALKQDLREYQIGESLLGLAKTFEDQISPIEEKDIIPFFYNDNMFFADAFQLYSKISPENLQSSLAIYDSILVSIHESSLITEAQFRLAEIQYRIIGDFDKSSALYMTALSQNPPIELTKKIVLRIGDVLLAKGNFNEAISFLDSIYSVYKMPEVKNKLVETHLFSGRPDTVLMIINEIFSTINPTNNSFNDLMEIRDIINHYYSEVDETSKTAFIEFLKSEYLLKQGKISEASQLLDYIIKNNKDSELVPLISLRRAIVLMRLKKFDQALSQVQSIENTIFADRSIIMSGQIYEQIYNNTQKALAYYMRIINDYSDSIYSEPIRYHIRRLNNIEKI